MNHFRLLLLLLLPAPVVMASTADQHGLETYLLPVYTSGMSVPGQYGSQWRAQLTIHNASNQPASLGPCNVPSPTPCPPSDFVIEPGKTQIDPAVGFTDAGPRGRLVYVHRDIAPLVDMTLRLADTSRHSTDAGTEIPVVRSRDFHTATLRLHNVPLHEAGRVMLRIFDIDDSGTSTVAVGIYRLDGTLLQRELHSFTPSGYPQPDGLPYAPSIIELPLSARPEAVRIEVRPLSEGLRFWAYVSITNNATQHVTLVTPP